LSDSDIAPSSICARWFGESDVFIHGQDAALAAPGVTATATMTTTAAIAPRTAVRMDYLHLRQDARSLD